MTKKMRKKTIFEAMKLFVENSLDSVPLALISIGAESTIDDDTKEISNFIKAEVEVPRGYDMLSKCRFTVKIVDVPLKVTEIQLEDNDYIITLTGLQITYVDVKGTVYFKADKYDVKPVA